MNLSRCSCSVQAPSERVSPLLDPHFTRVRRASGANSEHPPRLAPLQAVGYTRPCTAPTRPNGTHATTSPSFRTLTSPTMSSPPPTSPTRRRHSRLPCQIWTSFELPSSRPHECTLCAASTRRFHCGLACTFETQSRIPLSDVHAHEQKRGIAGQWLDRV